MRSMTVWKQADRPNYNTNIDYQFTYSEVPYLEDYDLQKIPDSLDNLIQHVDYWGEGKIVLQEGIRGFSDCYNINHQYQLVSSGPDLDRKIPNRIPVRSEDDCDTSGYIKDDSVKTVTVAGERLNSSCAKDIARIVNRNDGMVVVYGVSGNSQEIKELSEELSKKGFAPCPNVPAPIKRQYYDSHVAFYNTKFRENLPQCRN